MTSSPARRGRHLPGRGDEGFTLAEVMISVVVLMTVLASIAVFFVSGIRTSAALQRRDAATQLADEAMELVRAVPPVDSSGGVSALVKGRTRAAVDAQWLARPTGLLTTTPLWDPLATGSPVIPPRVVKTVGQQRYVIDTFIGSCRQGLTDATCSNALAVGAVYFRIVVRVSWDPGPGATCGGQPCEYVLTTVVNGENEPVFSTVVDLTRPVAGSDTYTVFAGVPIVLDLLSNDTGTFNNTPLAVLSTGPANGVLTGAIATGAFVYTSTPLFSGTDTFRYQVTDTSGLSSDPGTVTINVVPGVTVADAAAVSFPGPITVDVLANDTGLYRTGVVTAITPPASGTATITGNRVVYTPALGYQGTVTMTYTNLAGGRTAQAVLSIVVTAPSAPDAGSPTVCVRRSSGVTVSLTLAASITGTTAGGTFVRTSDPDSTVWRTPTGPVSTDDTGAISVRARSTPAVGLYPMGYRFTDAWGRSDTGTVTLQVKSSCP